MPSPDPRQPAARPSGGRLRPEPTSALAPAPSPLMSVPDDAARPGPKGRRQHHRGPVVGEAVEELVYLSGRVPRALRDELHIRAIHEGRSVVDLLREAIRTYLDR
jgi:hypothetical protein